MKKPRIAFCALCLALGAVLSGCTKVASVTDSSASPEPGANGTPVEADQEKPTGLSG